MTVVVVVGIEVVVVEGNVVVASTLAVVTGDMVVVVSDSPPTTEHAVSPLRMRTSDNRRMGRR